MKILKLKSIFFSLMAITLVTVFLTSCEKDQVELENTIEQTENSLSEKNNLSQEKKSQNLRSKFSRNDGGKIMIPTEYENSSAEEIAEFIANLSEDEIEARQYSYLIWRYLGYTKQLDQLHADNPNFDILTFKDLNRYAPNQFDAFEEFVAAPPPELFSITIIDECIWGFIHIVVELVCEYTLFPPGLECRLVVSVNLEPC